MASPSSIELGDEVLVQQDKTNKLSTAFNPFKVISKTGNILVVESPTLREPILQEHKSCEAIEREVPHPNNGQTLCQHLPTLSRNTLCATHCQPTTQKSTAGLRDRAECLVLQENGGAAPAAIKDFATPEDKEITREGLCCLKFSLGNMNTDSLFRTRDSLKTQAPLCVF